VIATDVYTKSSFSGAGGCVEVRLLEDGSIGLRDSKDISRPPHIFTQHEWSAFLAGARAGEFDLPPECL
jgi:Domain of unknown function (DUF397)